ncbi:hypothetical protein [Chitinimonas naiadis]
MINRSKRLQKKLHKYWLDYGVIDASVNSLWRKRLFEAQPGDIFSICKNDTAGLHQEVVNAIYRYDLKFSVRTAVATEAESWLSENGMVLFKFWATGFPTLSRFTGNNPDVI